MLEKGSETTLPIHLSKSAPDNHAVSSSSPVRQEMIQSIKSLDDMLISSYRASLSHHSYARLSHSKKTDVETGVDVIFVGEAENAQLGIEDVSLSEIAIDQDKTQSHKKEKIISNEMGCNIQEGTTYTVPVHKLYHEKKEIPHDKQSNKNNGYISRSSIKQIVKRNSSNVFFQPRALQSSSGPSQVESPNSRGNTYFSYQHKTPPNDHKANVYRKLNSSESVDGSPAKVQSNRPSFVLEDGLIINTNVKGLSAHSKKMSMFLHLFCSMFY